MSKQCGAGTGCWEACLAACFVYTWAWPCAAFGTSWRVLSQGLGKRIFSVVRLVNWLNMTSYWLQMHWQWLFSYCRPVSRVLHGAIKKMRLTHKQQKQQQQQKCQTRSCEQSHASGVHANWPSMIVLPDSLPLTSVHVSASLASHDFGEGRTLVTRRVKTERPFLNRMRVGTSSDLSVICEETKMY